MASRPTSTWHCWQSMGDYGLLGISERVALLQGKLRLHNQPGGGLLLEVELPHPPH
ncbi:MAG: hypothetical protein HC876_22100 [Chloroflexaceae bacterium]|nr:hypothetical protein [Chloroflexaceae bacterium]